MADPSAAEGDHRLLDDLHVGEQLVGDVDVMEHRDGVGRGILF